MHMAKYVARPDTRTLAQAARCHRINILATLLVICRQLEPVQASRPARQACGEVADMMERLLARERSTARSGEG